MGKNKGAFFLCYYPLTDADVTTSPNDAWQVPMYDSTNDTMYVGAKSLFDNDSEIVSSRVTTTETLTTSAYNWFCNTDAGAYTVTLPASGDVRVINSGASDNALTVAVSSGVALLGVTNDTFILNDGETIVLTYNSTDGWY